MPRVLAVDDAIGNLHVYERILKQVKGIEVVPYTTSRAALMWSEDNPVDLLIVDYNMPTPNGLEFVEAFKQLPDKTSVPIVMITSAREHEIRYKAFDLGVDDFLQKPADPVMFLARVRNLLKLREREQRLAERTQKLTEEVRRITAEIGHAEEETIFRLTRAAEFRDKETKNHTIRMGHYARLLCARIGMPTFTQETILLAAPMHDIGKVAIPDAILLKEGPLTPPEWEIMKSHAQAGYEILKGSDSPVIQMGAEIAVSHHEKFDGSGYPNKIVGEAIPLSGRICALTDVFDALLSDRPYKKAWPLHEVMDHLRKGKGAHFDPKLVESFIEIMPEVQKVRQIFSDKEAAA